MEKSAGASTQPCLTPFSDEMIPSLALVIIQMCNDSTSEFVGASILSSFQSRVLPTVSHAFVKSTNLSSMHLSWSCLRQKIISTVLLIK